MARERITTTLSKAQAETVFSENCILFCNADAVPEYRIIELFGIGAGAFIEANLKDKGFMTWGRDANSWGSGAAGNVYYRDGFNKVVTWHNMRIIEAETQDNEAFRQMGAIWQERSDRLAAQDAEDERKRQEAKEKRAAAAAARKAKKAAQTAAQ